MLSHEPFAVGDNKYMQSKRQVRFDALLYRSQAQVFETLDLKPREWLELEVGERTPAPGFGVAHELRRLFRIAGLERAPSVCQEVLEALVVELAGLDSEHVSGRLGGEPRLVSAERLSQTRDLNPQRVVAGLWTLIAQQLLGESIAGHHAVGAQQQKREQGALPGAAERERNPVGPHLDRAKDPEFHRRVGHITILL